MSCTSTIFRRPLPDDWQGVVAVMPRWWDGHDLRALLPKVFFEHFRSTSLLVEHEDDDEVDGVAVTTDHGPHGEHLVRFQLFLEPEADA